MPKLFSLLVISSILISAGCSSPAAAETSAPPDRSTAAIEVAPTTTVVAATPVPTLVPTSTPQPIGLPPAGENPIGLLLGGGEISDPFRVELAQALGAHYFRPWYVTVEDWDGECFDVACDLAPAAGLQLVLTVRNNVGFDGTTTPARDLDLYRQTVGAILDRVKPVVLVVENEESSPLYWNGTVEDYAAQVTAACEVAHARGIACANGGLASDAVSLLVWADLIERGQFTEACDFVGRVAPDLPVDLCRLTSPTQMSAEWQTLLARARQLLGVYQHSGQDLLNFHWYAPDKGALSDVAAYLRRTVALPLMSNEMGQRDQTPDTVEKLLAAALDLKLAYVIWFSLDRNSQALHNPDGSVRPNGQAFRTFMQARFQTVADLPAVVAAAPPTAVPTLPAFQLKPAPKTTSTVDFSQVISDVTYCTTNGVELKMDAYFPKEPAAPAPVIMFVHGGGWVAGTKTGTPGLSYFVELARRGYFIASIDYRLAPTYTFPANIMDVKCAVRSLRANAAQWNIDPNRIGAWGASAGGHLVALLGTSDAAAGWDVGEYADQSSRVQLVVDLYGIQDLTTEYVVGNLRGLDRMVFGATNPADPILKAASPVTHITADDPPFLLIHGDLDNTIPYTQSQIMHDALLAGGVQSDYVLVKNAGHGFGAVGGPIAPTHAEISRLIIGFFDQHLR